MVLSAGLGTRMAPANGNGCPSRWCALNGKALIDHVLDRLAAAGVARAVVNVHHKADQIEQHLQGRQTPGIEISDERAALLDTGGGVNKALPRLGRRAVLDPQLRLGVDRGRRLQPRAPVGAWDDARMDCLMLLALASASHGYQGRGDFALESDGRIRRRKVEQEMVPFAFTGVSIAHPRLFDGAPEGAFSLNAVWSRAIDGRPRLRHAHGRRVDACRHAGSAGAGGDGA